jgi:3',5'-cyclic AMP phosphodiesterase CpdA
MFRVAHLSDLHATPVRTAFAPLLGKRFFGWLSWQLRRRHAHLPRVLDALLADLRREAPEQIVVTGDLTNVAGEEEFPDARRWLERIGAPERVSLVPGNHDAYVAVPCARGIGLWREYIDSDAQGAAARAGATPGAYPAVRVRGPVAVVGVCSALPTPPLMATGRVGAAQLARLEASLASLGAAGLFRIVLIHHPPQPGAVSRRRALRDQGALRAVLARAGAELVLHGHTHRTRVDAVAGPAGPIPVVGARSASDVGLEDEKRAQYHVYEIERAAAGEGFRVRMRVRGYDPAAEAFVDAGVRWL